MITESGDLIPTLYSIGKSLLGIGASRCMMKQFQYCFIMHLDNLNSTSDFLIPHSVDITSPLSVIILFCLRMYHEKYSDTQTREHLLKGKA